MKTLLTFSLLGALVVGAVAAPATPVVAQERLVAQMVTQLCLPYANRARSFERVIKLAKDMRFRRPYEDRGEVLEEFASEIDLISRDGAWRINLEENTIELGDREVYAVSCALSSTRASANELEDLARRAFSNDEIWTRAPSGERRWDRRSAHPEESRIEAIVVETPGERPALVIRGLYF